MVGTFYVMMRLRWLDMLGAGYEGRGPVVQNMEPDRPRPNFHGTGIDI